MTEPVNLDKFIAGWVEAQTSHFAAIRLGPVDQRLFEAYLPPHGGRILDVGCQVGQLVKKLIKEGYFVDGVDLPGVIAVGKEDFPEIAVFLHPRNLEYENLPTYMPYDLVLCLGMIEHLVNGNSLFGKVAAVLRPGGTAYFTSTNRDRVSTEQWHFHNYTQDEFRTLAEEAGLEVIKVHLGETETSLRGVFAKPI